MFLFVTVELYIYLFLSCISRMQKARGKLRRCAQAKRNNLEKIQPTGFCKDSKISNELHDPDNSKHTAWISYKRLQENSQQHI